MQPKDQAQTVKFAEDASEELQSRLNQQLLPPFNWTTEEIVRKFFQDQGYYFHEEGIKQVIASVSGGKVTAIPTTQTPAQEVVANE